MKVTLCVIGRNNEATVGQLFDSVGKSVDEWVFVDTGSTDKTKEIVQAKAAEFGIPLKLADFEWVNDFSKARAFSFSLADDADFIMWLDTDDVLVGGEKIRATLESLRPDMAGVRLPYYYAFDEHGNPKTIHSRERIIRVSTGWRWEGPVHESLLPPGKVGMGFVEEVRVEHHVTLSDEDKAARNLGILMSQWEAAPEPRTAMYIGYQYFSQSKWPESIEWFERFLAMTKQTMEAWQALIYTAKAYIMIGKPYLATGLCHQAISLAPEWADPYFVLGMVAVENEEWEEVVWWDKVGRQAERPMHALFINPLDYTWRPELALHVALFQLRRYDEALASANRALAIRPGDEFMVKARDLYAELVRRQEQAKKLEAYADLATKEELVDFASRIPRNLLSVSSLRDKVMAPVFEEWWKNDGKKRIVFICPTSLESWGPDSINQGGIGGSETAVIHVARELAALGNHVTVFNESGMHEGVHDNVGYFPLKRFEMDSECDLLVSWRYADLGEIRPKNAKQMWLWMHDLHARDRLTKERAAGFDLIRPVSHWHAGHMKKLYPFLGENVVPTTNGIDYSRFDIDGIVRNPKRCVYLSSPDRGLYELLDMWHWLCNIPGAELHVYYGFNNLMTLAARGSTFAAATITKISEMKEAIPGITFHGRIGQSDMARELLQSGVWLYPASFLEVSCIVAMECMATGLAAVTSNIGALPETMGDWGYRVKGWTTSKTFQREFIGMAGAIIEDAGLRDEIAAKGKVMPPSWADVAREWNGRIT